MLNISLLHSIIYPVQHKKVNDFLQTPSYTVARDFKKKNLNLNLLFLVIK